MAAQQELDRANDRTKTMTSEVTDARTAFRLAKKVVKDADLEKRKVTDEIEILRPKVEDAPADSGLVEAYREAIAVYIPAQTGANFDRTHKRGSKSFWHSLMVSEMHRTRPLRHTHSSSKSQRGRKLLMMSKLNLTRRGYRTENCNVLID